MRSVVVVSGGLVETLQAAALIAAVAQAGGQPVLVACPPSAADIARNLLGAGEVLPLAALSNPSARLHPRLWWELRRRRLDVAFVCTELASVRLAVYLAGIPRRVGSTDGRGQRLLSDRVPSEAGQNRAITWRGLRRALGPIDETVAASGYQPGPAATTVAEQLLMSNGVEDGRLLVAIAPGLGFAEDSVSVWSPERFAHLANRLASRHSAGIVLVGDQRDRDAVAAMRLDLAAPTLDVCGDVTLPITAAILARCDLLVSADTPLLHLAASVGTPSVGLFGPTSGRLRAPAGSEHRVVQALPDGRQPGSLERIRVDDVLAGLESAL